MSDTLYHGKPESKRVSQSRTLIRASHNQASCIAIDFAGRVIGTSLGGGRVFDCKDDYDSTVASCKMPYGDPEDMDDLRLCLQAAKDDYESCNEDCMD